MLRVRVLAVLCLPLAAPAVSIAQVPNWGSCVADPPPPIPMPADARSIGEEIEVFSGKVEFDLDGDASFSDQIVLRSADQQLRADRAQYDAKKGIFQVHGDVEFRDDQTRVIASDARYDSPNGVLGFDSAEFQIWSVPARGSADNVKFERVGDAGGKLRLRNATYTSCPAGDDGWQLSADSIRIDQTTGVGTARGARLDFNKVPILYLPYISFPATNERKTGWLIPDLGSSERRGLDVAAPFYWNIAPNYDATFTPRYMSKRGLQMGAEGRYLLPGHEGNVYGEYLSDDDQTGEDRSLIAFFNQSQLWGGWRGTLDFINVSDSQYFEDFSSGIADTSQTHLERSLRFDYFSNPWTMMFRVQDYQTIDDAIPEFQEPYKRLPQLAVRGFSPRGLFGLRYDLVADATFFDRSVGVTGFRGHVTPEVGLPLGLKVFELEPSVAYSYTTYNLSDTAPAEEDNPDFGAPIYSVDLRQTFERITSSSRWLQTLEPRVLYTYIPLENQDDVPVFDTAEADLNIVQLFRKDRFVGYDRLGDTNQMALGVTTRLLDAGSGEEFLRATIGNIRYFSDQDVTLPGGMPSEDNSSDYLAEFGARFFDNWRTNLGYQWNSDDSETIKAEARLQYRPDNERVANLGYRFRRDQLQEIDVALAWPIAEAWSFVGRYNYSIEDSEPLDQFVGIEYETCCWGVRAVWRRYLTSPEQITADTSASDTSISLQLVLKGFSSPGTAAEQMLDRGILDYD